MNEGKSSLLLFETIYKYLKKHSISSVDNKILLLLILILCSSKLKEMNVSALRL